MDAIRWIQLHRTTQYHVLHRAKLLAALGHKRSARKILGSSLRRNYDRRRCRRRSSVSRGGLGTENSKFKEVEGVLVPVSFSQKFEMPMGAFFAEFNVKEVKLNQQLGEDAFAIPR